ncbi:MAG TPA: 50S ribosomal protein L24 [Acidimicrobiales bacterium]|nr:50S ribosomal protein L24 [Acidimicrobiales bacterium]
MNIRRGDQVIVLSGTWKGKRGEVVRALPGKGSVVVEGINRMKRHQRTTQLRKRAGIIEKDLPVPVSIVSLVCPKEHQPARIKTEVAASANATAAERRRSKRRVCASCGEAF